MTIAGRSSKRSKGSGTQQEIAARGVSATAKADFTLSDSLALIMRDAHRTFTKSLERRIAVYGITSNMWYYLRLLWENDGCTPGDLSEQLGIKGPTAIEVLDDLERKQLIRRERDPADKRRVLIRLTPKGLELKQALLHFAIEVQDLAMKDVSTEDEAVFRSVLRNMLLRLQADQAS